MNEIDLENAYWFDDIIEVGVNELFYENGNLIPKENFKHPKNGAFKAYTKRGYLYLEINYVNNKKNGETKCYFENSDTIHWTNNYTNDELDGICTSYFKNGNKDEEITFKNGVKEGLFKRFYESGKLFCEELYLNNKQHGLSKIYYPDGINLYAETEFIDDKQQGKSIQYYESGKIKKEAFWEGDVCTSRTSYFESGKVESIKEKNADFEYWYYETGELDTKMALKNHKRNGEFFDYYKNGKIKRKGFFKNEKFEGEVVGYFKNGKVKFINNHKNDLKDGESIHYFANGNIEEFAPYKKGNLNGTVIKYYKNGNVKCEYEFKNNLRDGYSIHYDENGEIISKALYKKGEIIDNVFDYGIVKKSEEQEQEKEQEKEEKKAKKPKSQAKKRDFRLEFVNCNRNIEDLTEKIIKSGRLDFSVCIYGEPGVGKSAYAEYLAERLGLDVVKKTAADILDQYIGNSEQKIKEAFDEAEKKKAVLIIDEVDSFLRSRGMSTKSWEITMVNQMLTCMQEFEYPFFCTTNFVDMLDDASLRRFTFKLKFGFLKPEQIKNAFEFVFKLPINSKIQNMKGLTVSDFVNVKKECDILLIDNVEEIANMLEEVVSLKKCEELKNSVGF